MMLNVEMGIAPFRARPLTFPAMPWSPTDLRPPTDLSPTCHQSPTDLPPTCHRPPTALPPTFHALSRPATPFHALPRPSTPCQVDREAQAPPTTAQEFAAACLSEVALLPANRTAIERAGGISPLVALLNWPVYADDAPPRDAGGTAHDPLTSKKHAAAALARLSTEEPKAALKDEGHAKMNHRSSCESLESTGSSDCF